MQANNRSAQYGLRVLAALLSFAMVFTMMPALGISGSAYAEDGLTLKTPEVVVSGTAVIGGTSYTKDNVVYEKAYTRAELKAMSGGTDVVYSSIKTQEPYTKLLYRSTGVYLSSLLAGTQFNGDTDNLTLMSSDSPTYYVVFDQTKTESGKDARNSKKVFTPGFNTKRYYFPGVLTGEPSDAEEVPSMLTWASSNASSGVPGSPVNEKDNLTLNIGQLNVTDQNNAAYSKYIAYVIGGEELTDAVLTVGNTSYTRKDLLLMDYAERQYSYVKEGSTDPVQTNFMRGVPMSVLLDGAKDSDVVAFAAADGYDVAASGMTVKQLIDGNYMLAYAESETANGDYAGIYETAKKDPTKFGFLRLCGDGFQPAKLVNQVTVTSGSGIDYSTSPYKHITNGGITGQTGPYRIDAITGATLTIEGPGAESSIPLAVKDMEEQDNGCFRGNFTDKRNGQTVERTYEGVDMYCILHNMSKGTNGIRLTDKAAKVVVKNQNREAISTFTLAEIEKAHNDGRPILVAYGTSYTNGTGIKPFVFDYTAGGDDELGNYDGCLKLVYDTDTYGSNGAYTRFGNMAYIYVEEADEPGYKHDNEPYSGAANSEYILTVTGDALGKEVNYTVRDLEELVQYDDEGNVPDVNEYGYRNEYSLANSTYWYVNEYEGVKLWSLLRRSDLPASAAADAAARDIEVSFKSTDNYGGFDTFTLAQIADPNSFSFYKKNTADPGDNTYGDGRHEDGEPEDELHCEEIRHWDDTQNKWVGDKVDSGYPVLVAYGVNKYPYVKSNKLDGFLSGLQNDGGPLRVIWGKTGYGHANGSNQAKLVEQINVGSNENHYATHKYNPTRDGAYAALADNELSVKVTANLDGGESRILTDKSYKIGDIEDIVYDGKLDNAALQDVRIKAKYQANSGYTDIYEGVDLNYFLNNVVGLSGTQGTISFIDGEGESHDYDLETILSLNNGLNNETGVTGLKPVIAYGKNGYPLVLDKNAAGYVKTVKYSEGDADFANEVTVKNQGGPLEVLIPSTDINKLGEYVANVTAIEIRLEADKYAHVNEPYDTYAEDTLTVSGAGTRLSQAKSFRLSDIEGKQKLLVTDDYSLRSSSGTVTEQRFRGINLYEFLKSTDIGLKSTADKVIITTTDNRTSEFSIDAIQKNNYLNTVTNEDDLLVMLAFGSASVENQDVKDGLPLVEKSSSDGYNAAYGNDGGPLKLIFGQIDETDANKSNCVKNVASIEVTEGETRKWDHNQGVFTRYLTDRFEVIIKDRNGTEFYSREYTLADLEGMDALAERVVMSTTSTNEYEGLALYKFIQKELKAANAENATLKTVNVIKNRESEVYAVDILGKIGTDQLINGMKDGETRVPLLLAYAVDGYPLAFGDKKDPKGEGYDSKIGNDCGPIRLMVHNTQGACISEVNKMEIFINEDAPAQPAGESFDEYIGDGKEGNLPISGIRSTSVNHAGDLFIGTYGGGMSVKGAGADSFVTYNLASNPALTTGVVSAVAADDSGGVWLSQNASYIDPTGNAGVIYMNASTGEFVSYRAADTAASIPNDYVQAIKVADDGCVWIGSFGGLTKYDPAKDTWQTWDELGIGGATKVDFPAESVCTIELDKKGGVWVGFYPDSADPTGGTAPFIGGFAYFKNGKVVRSYKYTSPADSKTGAYRLGDVWVRDITLDDDGNAWVAASGSYKGMDNCGGKLWYVNAEGGRAVRYDAYKLIGEETLGSADNSEVRAITIDPDGGLWLGTSADGIVYVENPTVENGRLTVTAQYSSKAGSWKNVNNDNVYCLDIYGKTLYSGTAAGLTTHEFDFVNSYSSGGSSEDAEDLNEEIERLKDELAQLKAMMLLSVFKTGATVTPVNYDTVKVECKNANLVDGFYVNGLDIGGAGSSTFSGLVLGKTYKYTVQPYVMVKGEPVLGEKITVKGSPALNKPVINTIEPGRKMAALNWTAVEGAGGYKVYRSTRKSSGYKAVKTVKKGSTVSFTNKKLKKNKTYYYKLKAYRKVGRKTYYSGCSEAVKVKTK